MQIDYSIYTILHTIYISVLKNDKISSRTNTNNSSYLFHEHELLFVIKISNERIRTNVRFKKNPRTYKRTKIVRVFSFI